MRLGLVKLRQGSLSEKYTNFKYYSQLSLYRLEDLHLIGDQVTKMQRMNGLDISKLRLWKL